MGGWEDGRELCSGAMYSSYESNVVAIAAQVCTSTYPYVSTLVSIETMVALVRGWAGRSSRLPPLPLFLLSAVLANRLFLFSPLSRSRTLTQSSGSFSSSKQAPLAAELSFLPLSLPLFLSSSLPPFLPDLPRSSCCSAPHRHVSSSPALDHCCPWGGSWSIFPFICGVHTHTHSLTLIFTHTHIRTHIHHIPRRREKEKKKKSV